MEIPNHVITIEELNYYLKRGANNFEDYFDFLIKKRRASYFSSRKIIITLLQHGLIIDHRTIALIFRFESRFNIEHILRLIINYFNKNLVGVTLVTAIKYQYLDVAEFIIDETCFSPYFLLSNLIENKNNSLFCRLFNKYSNIISLDDKNKLLKNAIVVRNKSLTKYLYKNGSTNLQDCKERSWYDRKYRIYFFIKRIELELYLQNIIKK